MNLRYEILKVCAANPGAPIDEIADTLKHDRQKTAWSVRDCAKDGLLSKRRDDVTGQPGYTLTAEGRQRLAEGPGSKQGSNMKRGDSEGGETDAPAAVKESLTASPAAIQPPQYDPNEVAFTAPADPAEQPATVSARLADAEQRALLAAEMLAERGRTVETLQEMICTAGETLAPCVPGAIDTGDMELQEIAEAVAGHVADLAVKLGCLIAANEAMQEEIESLREMNVKLDAALQNARAPDFVLAPPAFDRVTAAVHSKYHREIKPGVFVDVYDVLHAWGVINPALQHLVKKALQPGERGHKTMAEDLNDIIVSANRAKELEQAA